MGQVLPNEFDLARQFGVSIGTIRKAVEGLEAAKIVVRKQGRGTFVARDGAAPATEPVSWFGEIVVPTDSGEAATIAVEQRVAKPHECTALLLHAEKKIISIRRRRAFPAGGTAVRQDRAAAASVLRPRSKRSAAEQPLRVLRRLLRYPDRQVPRAGDGGGGRRREIAEVLCVPVGSAALRIERTCFSASGEPIEWRRVDLRATEGLGFSGVC